MQKIQPGVLPGLRRRAASTSLLARWQWVLLAAALLVLDAAALTASFTVAHHVRFDLNLAVFQEVGQRPELYRSIALWALPIWLALHWLYGLYDLRRLFASFREYGRLVSACTVASLCVVVLSFLYDLPSIARGWLVLVWLTSILFIGGGRFAARRVVGQLRRRGWLLSPVAVLGANPEGQALARELEANPTLGARVIGFLASGADQGEPPTGPPVLGRLGDLAGLVEQAEVREVIVASSALSRSELLELYRRFGHDPRVELRLSSGLFEMLTTGVSVHQLGGLCLMEVQRSRITGPDAVMKTVLDYVGAVLGVLLLSPLLVAIALAIRLDSPGPIVYRRRVLGRSGRPFDAFKFRTMIPDRRGQARPIDFPDRRSLDKPAQDPRVTRTGRLLRRASLDELPQLFNVLRGEMSLSGPRMIAPDELPRYGRWGVNLLTVRPGITGPWQVRGRGDLAYDERVRLSMDYIRNYTIWLDLEILLRTLPAVLGRKGAY